MTVTEANPGSGSTAPSPPDRHDTSFRDAWVQADIWLIFIVFPLTAVLADDDLTSGRKIATAGLVVAFAAVHMLAYRDLIRRDLGLVDDRGSDPRSVWFGVLVALTVVVVVVGTWPMLAMTPYLVSFAVFNFSWRAALATFVVTLTMVIGLSALGGAFEQSWLFSALVLSVGAATAMTRIGIERQADHERLRRQLALSQERDRVARDVHDVLGHSLTVTILKTQVCDRLLAGLDRAGTERDPEIDSAIARARAQLAEIESVSRRSLSEIRATVGGLRTVDLADEVAAARVVLADAQVALTVTGDPDDLALRERAVVAWVVREAVTNVVRHARATTCEIHLAPGRSGRGDRVLLRVADNGVGLGSNPRGNGLVGLAERVEAEGATLRVTSDDGTRVEVVVESAATVEELR